MGVSADAGVGIGLQHVAAGAGKDHPREVLDVDLVHDARSGRYHREIVKGGLPPAQELVALPIALIFQFHIALESVVAAEDVGDHRVVDHQLGRRQGIDPGRVAPEVGDRLAHGGQVDHTRHPGEVLHDHPGRGELDLTVGLSSRIPAAEGADIVSGDIGAVLGTEQILQQHLEAVREPLLTLDSVQAEDLVRGLADVERGSGSEAVDTHLVAPPVTDGATPPDIP